MSEQNKAYYLHICYESNEKNEENERVYDYSLYEYPSKKIASGKASLWNIADMFLTKYNPVVTYTNFEDL